MSQQKERRMKRYEKQMEIENQHEYLPYDVLLNSLILSDLRVSNK